MSQKTAHLNLGPPSLSRKWCSLCREETLHKWNACIHHGKPADPQPPPCPEKVRYLRLSTEKRDELRSRVRAGELTHADAARIYGVSAATAGNIASEKR
jgi:hypothetical protein